MAKAKKKTVKKKLGKPSLFTPKMAAQAEIASEKGFTDAELGRLFGVSRQTIHNWKIKYPLFSESLNRGKAIADEKVERALYERATGYSYPDVHITQVQGEIVVTPIIKHYAPDPTSCIFWLKNRKPGQWRDKQEYEHGVTDEFAELLKSLDGKSGGLPDDQAGA